jgi:autotransporter-associated beta strand protein
LGASGAATLSGAITPANGKLKLGGGGGTLVVAGVIADSSSPTSVTITGGTVHLTNNGNTFSGGVTLAAGTLQFDNNTLGTGLVTFAGGVLQWSPGNTQDISGRIAPVSAGQIANLDVGGNSVTFTSPIGGTGGLTKGGAGTLVFTVPISYTGGTTVSAGTLQGDTSTLTGFIVDNASLVFNQSTNGTFAGVISGGGSVTKSGSGTVVLSGSNSYSGGTTIAGGLLNAASMASLGSGPVAMTNGGSLTVDLHIQANVPFVNRVATFNDPWNTGTSDPSLFQAVINWGDGTSTSIGTVNVLSPQAATYEVTGAHAYVSTGNYTIGITITKQGVQNSSLTLTNYAAVTSAAGIATAPLNFSGTEGQALANVAVAKLTGVTGSAPPAGYTAVIFWGDGTTSTATILAPDASHVSLVQGSHTYADESTPDHTSSGNSYRVVVDVYDGTTLAAEVSGAATIIDPPVVASGVSFTAVEGTTSDVAAVATFTDPGGAEAVGEYSAMIDWGDGQSSAGAITGPAAGGVFTVSGSHLYAEEGSFTITTTINHETATPAIATSQASVADVPVVATGVSNVAPTAVVGQSFTALAQTGSGGVAVPRVAVAAGPDCIAEVVNSAVAFYNMAGGQAQGTSPQLLKDFFAPAGADGQATFTGAVALYDEDASHFVIGCLETNAGAQTSYLDLAFSKTTNPADGFVYQRINLKETAAGQSYYGDSLRIGRNYEAFAFTVNMLSFNGGTFDHVQVVTIDKTSALAANGSAAPQRVDLSGSLYHSLTPAVMHGVSSSMVGITYHSLMWFVEDAPGGSSIRVVQLQDALNPTPAAFTYTDLGVMPYLPPPAMHLPGNQSLTVADSGFVNADWRNNFLVAAHTVGIASDTASHVQWFEIEATRKACGCPDPVSLMQQGVVNPGAGIDTALGAMAIDAGDNIGMAFEQSSAGQYLSTYATGQPFGSPIGQMELPILVRGGQGNLAANSLGAAAAISPSATGGGFWADGAFASGNNLWGMAVGNIMLPTGMVATAGQSFSGVVATFQDPAGAESVDQYSATILWGDGSALDNGALIDFNPNTRSFEVRGSHAYASAGTYSISVTVHHGTAAPVTVTSQVNIADAPPQVVGALVIVGQQYQQLTHVKVASFTGAGSMAVIDWGDETGTSAGTIEPNGSGGYDVFGSHAYYKAATGFQVTVTVTNSHGSAGMGLSKATISGVTLPANPASVYVDDNWSTTAAGAEPAADPLGGLIYGYNAFATIQEAVNAAAAGGTMTIYGGSYTAPVTFTKALASVETATNPLLPGQTAVQVAGTISLGVNPLSINCLCTTIISGAISGSAAVTKTGAGSLTLSGHNTYSGTTTVPSGTLTIANSSALPDGASISVGNWPDVYRSVDQSVGGPVNLALVDSHFDNVANEWSFQISATNISATSVLRDVHFVEQFIWDYTDPAHPVAFTWNNAAYRWELPSKNWTYSAYAVQGQMTLLPMDRAKIDTLLTYTPSGGNAATVQASDSLPAWALGDFAPGETKTFTIYNDVTQHFIPDIVGFAVAQPLPGQPAPFVPAAAVPAEMIPAPSAAPVFAAPAATVAAAAPAPFATSTWSSAQASGMTRSSAHDAVLAAAAKDQTSRAARLMAGEYQWLAQQRQAEKNDASTTWDRLLARFGDRS